ncbi:GGDEF domain-containing protein [Marinobacter litoralis]|uniref:GGDEF domain-containing protein n=1 Tax=Marinobacter litoralis TaxID=187981 RepID=UPI0018EB5B7C|nr:GGDEF domain-containing protein [Marinobacter litoralis]MBJ6138015.1 GGDEF domain-containing protein [Marinobacter litoralis]
MKNLTSIQSSTSKPAKLAALRQAFQTWSQEPDPLARLTKRLSTTLSLENQLEMIAEEISAIIPFDSMQYRHRIARREFVFSTGVGGPHRCEYRLSLEGSHYGLITFHRRQRFSDDELAGFEMMLSAVVCPLRNACQFIAIEQAALTDSLTGIGNKRALQEELTRASSLSDRLDASCSLILCDLDHFKRINDTHGHVVGDHILSKAAEKIERAIRNSDSVYRFGGEEFAVLLPHTDIQEAKTVAERIRVALESIRVDGGETPITVTGSCGIATHLTNEPTEQWLARADEALYQAKACGRNCSRIFASIP